MMPFGTRLIALLLLVSTTLALMPPAAAVVPGTCGASGSLYPYFGGARIDGTASGSNTWCRVEVILRWQSATFVFAGCSDVEDHRVSPVPPSFDTVSTSCYDLTVPSGGSVVCAIGEIRAYRWSAIDLGWTFTGAVAASGTACY